MRKGSGVEAYLANSLHIYIRLSAWLAAIIFNANVSVCSAVRHPLIISEANQAWIQQYNFLKSKWFALIQLRFHLNKPSYKYKIHMKQILSNNSIVRYGIQNTFHDTIIRMMYCLHICIDILDRSNLVVMLSHCSTAFQ